jgi:hypothetical protein
MSELRIIWKSKHISLQQKVKLMGSFLWSDGTEGMHLNAWTTESGYTIKQNARQTDTELKDGKQI